MTRWLAAILVLVALGAWLWWDESAPEPTAAPTQAIGGSRPGAPAAVAADSAERGTSDAGETPQGRLERSVERTLSGRVVDESGTPLTDVAVHLAEAPALSPGERHLRTQRGQFLYAVASTRTAADGTYRLRVPARLADLPLQVHALPDRHGDVALRRVGAVAADERLPDLVAPAERPVHVVVVDDRNESPIAGARVYVRPEPRSLLRLPERDPGRSVRTNAAGRCELHGLPVGSYAFCAEAAGYASLELQGQAVQATETTEVLLALAPGRGLTGFVVDQAGHAVDGAHVEVLGVATANPTMVCGHTDGAGRFELHGLRPGLQQVRVGKPGFANLFRDRIEAGQPGLVLTLTAHGGIRLTVADDSGQPVQSYRVVARPDAKGGALRERTPESVAADRLVEGAFLLDDLEAGRWSLRLTASGLAGTVAGPFDVAEGSSTTAHVVLPVGAQVRCVVRLGNGSAAANATATLQPDGFLDGPLAAMLADLDGPVEPLTAAATADGSLVLAHVPAGLHQLRFDIPGHAPHFLRGVLVMTADLDLGTVALPPSGSLRGSALVDGAVDARVVVQVLALAGGNLPAGFRCEATVDAEGRWRCPTALTAGRYAVMAGRRLAADPFAENQDNEQSRVVVEIRDQEVLAPVDLRIRARR